MLASGMWAKSFSKWGLALAIPTFYMGKLDKAAARNRPPISSRMPSNSTLEWANRQA